MANKTQKHIVDIGKENVSDIVEGLKKDGECYIKRLGKLRVTEVKERDAFIPTVGHKHLPKSKRVIFALNRGLRRFL